MAVSRGSRVHVALLIVALGATGCGTSGSDTPATPSPAACPNCVWRDATAESGVAYRHVDSRGGSIDYLPQTIGPGVAALDFDGDGLLDLSFAPGAGDESKGVKEPAAPLYRRTADGAKFEDAGPASGLLPRGCGQAVLAVDYDNDGYTDLVVTRYWAANLLYRNNGDGTFREVAAALGASGMSKWTSFAAAIDRDRDGLNDLYVGNYLDFRPEHWKASPGWVNHDMGKFLDTLLPGPYAPEKKVMLANRSGRFEAVDAGAENAEGRGLGAMAADLDDDGWLDLFVANDVSPCALMLNQKNGTFQDVAQAGYVAENRGSMGIALGDSNRDLKADLAVSHWVGDIPALYERVSKAGRPPQYADRARSTPIGQVSLDNSGWAIAFVDARNTGDEGLVVINGHTNPQSGKKGALVPQAALFLIGKEGQLAFPGPAIEDPVNTHRVGRGGVFADLDLDGGVDVVVANNNGPAEVWKNRGAPGAWIEVEARGTASNRDGIGTRVELLDASGKPARVKQIVSGDSFYSSNPYRVRFGLGAADAPVSLRLRWLSGRVEDFAGLAVRALHRLVEGAGKPGP
jgi:hypothetical protein